MPNAIHQSSTCLRWTIIGAEEFLTSLNGVQLQDTLKRRSLAYRDLQTTLLAAKTEPGPALAGLVAAAVCDEANTKLHIKGLDALIRNQGGGTGQGDSQAFGIFAPDVIIMAFTFRPVELLSFEELVAKKTNLRAALQTIAMRSTWLTAGRKTPSSAATQQYLPALDGLLNDDCIGKLLKEQLSPGAPYVRRARHFVMLLALHYNLMIFENDLGQQVTFLDALRSMARECSAFDARTQTWALKPGAVVFIVCHVRSQVLERAVGVVEARQRGARCSLAVIDALKVFGYLPDDSQRGLIARLRFWLFATSHADKGWASSTYKDCLDDVEAAWLNRQNS